MSIQEIPSRLVALGQEPDYQAKRIVPVILSGGAGTRLWPFSTNESPKQFLPLIEGGKTLFRQTLDRVQDRERFHDPLVVASMMHAKVCGIELSSEGEDSRLILEPVGRNTAPAIFMAALLVAETYGPDALMLVMPSDHVIDSLDEFQGAIFTGERAARAGKLVTFGVTPTGPETGYGYIQMADEAGQWEGVRHAARFVEKPSSHDAEAMLSAGDHLWNAGIFLFAAETVIREAQQLAPDMFNAVSQAYAACELDGIRVTPRKDLLESCPSASIDNELMERSSSVVVVPMTTGWSDVGSWDALATMFNPGTPLGPITAVDCESCYMRSDGLQVAALGVRDLIVVASGAHLLILPRGRSQEVKLLLSAMNNMAA